MPPELDFHPDCAVPDTLVSQIHLLDECNLRCKHCYVGEKRFEPRKKPSTNELKKRITLMTDFGKKMGFKEHTMNISGGEPTLRGDLTEIMQHIVDEGASPLLITNGLNLTPELAREIKQMGAGSVSISIEGTREYNDSLRGRGTFEKIIEAVNNAKDAGLRVILGITISKANVGNVKRLFEMLDGKVDKFHIREVTAIGAGQDLQNLSRKERREFYEFAHNWKGKTTLFIEDPPYCTISPDLPEERAGCAAFICLFCVDVNGSVYPCRKIPHKMGTVYNLDGAWNSELAKKLRNRDFNGKCGSCNIKWSCGGCRGYASATTGDMLGSDDRCLRNE